MRHSIFLLYLSKNIFVVAFLNVSILVQAQSNNAWVEDAIELAQYIEDNKLVLLHSSDKEDIPIDSSIPQIKTLDDLYFETLTATFHATEDEFRINRQTYIDEINRQEAVDHRKYMQIFDLYRDFYVNKNYESSIAGLKKVISNPDSTPVVKIRANIMLGYAYGDLSQPEKTIEALQNIDIITDKYDIETLVKNEIAEFEAYILQATGDRPGTIEAYRNLVKYGEELGTPVDGATMIFNLLIMVMETGDSHSISALDSIHINVAELSKNPKFLFLAYRTCGSSSLDYFSNEKALTCLEEAQKYERAARGHLSLLHHNLAIAHARAGDAKLAREYFQKLVDDPKTYNVPTYKKHALIAEAEVLLAENKSHQAFVPIREFIRQEKADHYQKMQNVTGKMREYAQKQLSTEVERNTLLESQSTLQASIIKRQRISLITGILIAISAIIFGFRQAKLSQKLRIARNEANEANRAKSEFLANMSHEIRMPMNGVLGMAEVLTRADLNEKQKRCAEIIYKSGNSLMCILNDILDFSKIESGKLELSPISFDLKEMAEEIILLLAPTAKDKKIEFIVHYAKHMPNVLIGDEIRIRQILTNLISNAIKFTESGHILLSLDGERHGNDMNLTIKVTDSGIGISEDKLKKIFEIFTQAEGSTTRQYGGTGLGLTISRKLVEAMGGDINVTSQVGKGSTFKINLCLPILEITEIEKQNFGSDQIETLNPCLGKRVLVVDDLDVHLTVMKEVLTEEGLISTCVGSAKEAYLALCNAKNRWRNFS